MNKTLLALFFIYTALITTSARGQQVHVSEYDDYLLTHLLTPAGPVPTAYDPNGVYPYQSYMKDRTKRSSTR